MSYDGLDILKDITGWSIWSWKTKIDCTDFDDATWLRFLFFFLLFFFFHPSHFFLLKRSLATR